MRKIRTKIQILTTVIVVFAVSLTVAPVVYWAFQDSDARMEKSLIARGQVFDNLMQARTQQMRKAVKVARRDDDLATAAAEVNLDALPELLAESSEIAGGQLALLLDLDGKLIASSEPLDPPRLNLPSLVNRAREQGLSRTPIEANGKTFEMVTVPMRDPLPVG